MRDARTLLESVSNAYPETLRELKASKFVNGRGGWRRVNPDLRKQLFLNLCDYINQVTATAFCYILDQTKFMTSKDEGSLPSWARTPWLASATTIAMFVQRENQKQKSNKGLSVIIFDDNKTELPRLSDFLLNSAPDVDTFYEKPSNVEPFDHVVNTAFAIKSEHSRLVQISDACAYALRRRAEIELGQQSEAWNGEREFIEQAVSKFANRIKFPTKTWVGSPSCDAARWLKDHGVSNLNKWVKNT